MDEQDVPQDRVATHAGLRKLLYAVGRDGEYVAVRSTGWSAEADATGAELEALDVLRRDAWRRGRDGTVSPLAYYMHLRRMDVALLSKTSGLSRWRIRRHFAPRVYATLSDRVLARYGDALGLDLATLRVLPDEP